MKLPSTSGRPLIAAIGLAAAVVAVAGPAAAGQCRDPWITQAIHEVTGRWPNGDYESGECTYTQYGGGHWNSYVELKGYVQQRLGVRYSFGGGASTGVALSSLPSTNSGGQRYVAYQGRWWRVQPLGNGAYRLISNDGASIVTNTSANIVTNASSN
ncbi:MAG TPA: hypothetical protein VG939_08820 [Caulobacteraceae bacterium]|nr:hypothetical protein [Caulobacteraceae bacterium]